MADVSNKKETLRTAKAYGEVLLGKGAFKALKNNTLKKGDVLAVSKIAGIQAAKKTHGLIPLCHNIFISNIDINFKLKEKSFGIEIKSTVKTNAKTGVEMEALTAVSVAALTIYDMCKSVDKGITISKICLLSKTGGKSGDYYDER
jgi:cyclic pyranopterin phosphate synthase